jgi:TP901 family phage tail tape measure protein
LADHEKVYSISFKTDQAEEKLRRLEALIAKLETRIKTTFAGGAVSKAIDSLVSKAERLDKKVTPGLHRIDAAAIQTRAQFEKAANAVTGLGTAMDRTSRSGTTGASSVSAGMTGLASSLARARSFADTLDRSLVKAGRDGATWAASTNRSVDAEASAMNNATKAGAALDSIMRKATRDGASGMRSVERAVKATETATRRTDEAIERMTRVRGEREKARALREIEQRIRGIGTSSGIAGASVTGLVAKLTAIIGVARGIRAIGSEFIAFDKAAVGASVRFGGALAEGTAGYKNMRKEVRGMAVDAGASLAAAAQSTEAWSKAGMDWAQTQKVMPVTLKAAIAMDLPDVGAAGDLLSDALGQFNLRTSDTAQLEKNITRIGDVVTKAADISTLDATQLFESFKTAAPMVDVVGGSIEQLAADLVTLGNAGIKGGEAGTQIRSIYGALTAPRGPARDIMKELGVEINDAKGNFRGLTQILADFESATKDIGSGEKTGMLTRIVGRENISGFLNLLRTGADEITKVEQGLNNSAGTMDLVYEGMKKSVTRQIDAVIGKVSNLGFTVLEQTDLFGKLGKYVDSIDWKAASATITVTIIPALEKIGSVISNVIWPAFKTAATLITEIFSPAISLASALLGAADKGGEGLGKTIGALVAAWFAYRAAVVAATAFNFVRYFAQIVTGAGSAAASQGTFTAALSASVKAAGALNVALGAIGAAFAGWTIGTIIFTEIVDPLMKALHAAEQLRDFNKQTLEQDTSKLSENVIAQRQKELKAEMWGLEVTGHKGKNGGLILNDDDSKRYKELQDKFNQLDNQRASLRHVRENKAIEEKLRPQATESLFVPKRNETVYKQSQAVEKDVHFTPASEGTFSYRNKSFEMAKPFEQAKPLEVKPFYHAAPMTMPNPMVVAPPMLPPPPQPMGGDYLRQDAKQLDALLAVNTKAADDARAFQEKLLKSTLAVPGGATNNTKTVNQTVNYTGPTLHLNATGLTEAQAEKMLRRALRDDKRAMADAARDAANSAGQTEF